MKLSKNTAYLICGLFVAILFSEGCGHPHYRENVYKKTYTCEPRLVKTVCQESYQCASDIDCSENMTYCRECCTKVTKCKKRRVINPCGEY